MSCKRFFLAAILIIIACHANADEPPPRTPLELNAAKHVKNLFSSDAVPEPLGRWVARSLPQLPQGDVAAYSNYGFGLAGYIVERVSGEPFADYFARHILEPLGMTRSTFQQPLPDALAPMMAKGYRSSDRPLGFFETIADAPAGALSATGTDMARFMRALLNGGALDHARIEASNQDS